MQEHLYHFSSERTLLAASPLSGLSNEKRHKSFAAPNGNGKLDVHAPFNPDTTSLAQLTFEKEKSKNLAHLDDEGNGDENHTCYEKDSGSGDQQPSQTQNTNQKRNIASDR